MSLVPQLVPKLVPPGGEAMKEISLLNGLWVRQCPREQGCPALNGMSSFVCLADIPDTLTAGHLAGKPP